MMTSGTLSFDMTDAYITFAAMSSELRSIARPVYFESSMIKNVEFYPPAVKMTFTDGTVTTAVAQGEDEYDPEIGMMTCIMKFLFKGSSYNNLFRKMIKKDEQRKKKAVDDARKAEEEVAIKKRQEEKKERRRQAWLARKRKEQVDMMAEAYKKALVETTQKKEDE